MSRKPKITTTRRQRRKEQKRQKRQRQRAVRMDRGPRQQHRQQRAGIRADIEQPVSHAMDFAMPYTALSQVAGFPMSVGELVARIRTFSWRESFIRLAMTAALVARSGSPRAEAVRVETVDPLLQATGSDTKLINRIHGYTRQNRLRMVTAHEEAISSLQHLILLEGSDAEAEGPGDSEVALWLLAVSDYLGEWAQPDTRQLSDQERLVAACVHVARFNHNPDLLTEISRTYAMFREPPPQGPLSDAAAWAALQTKAFGCTFVEYFESFLHPLSMVASLWGRPRHKFELPILTRETLLGGTSGASATVAAWLDDLTITRAAAQREIRQRLRGNGLPHAPTILLRYPFVDLENGNVVGASPWSLHGQLHAGIWARLLAAGKATDPKNGATVWLSAFGSLFEGWCRTVATKTRCSGRSQIILPSSPGAPDEIEDVVLKESDGVVLFSAKARLVPEAVSRHAQSRSGLLEWYEEFFFKAGDGKYRSGVLRQLDTRIRMTRAGDFEPRINRNARLHPVILTYDSLCDNTPLYKWVEARCAAHGLMQQPNLGPLALAHVSEFEALMNLAHRGRSVSRFLDKRTNQYRHRRLSEQLRDIGLPKGHERLPWLAELFRGLTDATMRRLSTVSDGGG